MLTNKRIFYSHSTPTKYVTEPNANEINTGYDTKCW